MDIIDFPPAAFVRQLSIHYPEAIFTYDLLWNRKDKEGFVSIDRKKIPFEFMMKVSKFIKHIQALAREGICNIVHDENGTIDLELVLWADLLEYQGGAA